MFAVYLFLGIIGVMTTIAVFCNIKELNLSKYFVLEEVDNEDGERDQLTPTSSEKHQKYTTVEEGASNPDSTNNQVPDH